MRAVARVLPLLSLAAGAAVHTAGLSAFRVTPHWRARAATRATVALKRTYDDIAREYNDEHAADVRQIALQHTADVDFTKQELAGAKIASIDDEGVIIEEVLCDVSSDTCVAVSMPIVFKRPCDGEDSVRSQLHEMAQLREEEAAPAPVSGSSVNAILSQLNTQFNTHLEVYVLEQQGQMLSPDEVIERVRATELDAKGFTIETIVCQMEDEGCEVREKRVLFAHACESVDEIEDMLVQLLS